MCPGKTRLLFWSITLSGVTKHLSLQLDLLPIVVQESKRPLWGLGTHSQLWTVD